MLTTQQIRNLHHTYCGQRLHKECRVEDCDCLCHDDMLWMDALDLAEWEREYFEEVAPRLMMWDDQDYEDEPDYGDEWEMEWVS